MKKVISNVWTVKLPNGDIHIDANVPETSVREFAAGKGKWGDNALYQREVKATTVFETIQEAIDYAAYTKVMDDNLKTILDESDPSRIAGIIQFMGNYIEGTDVPEQYTMIPRMGSGELLVSMAELFEPDFINLDEVTQAELLSKMEALYELIVNQSND